MKQVTPYNIRTKADLDAALADGPRATSWNPSDEEIQAMFDELHSEGSIPYTYENEA